MGAGTWIAIIAIGLVLIAMFYPQQFSQLTGGLKNIGKPTTITTGENLGKPGCLVDMDCNRINSCLDLTNNQTSLCKCNPQTGECIK